MSLKSAAVAVSLLLLAALPGGANATALQPGVSPRAMAWLGAPPTCPSADAVDGRESAQATRDLLSGKTKLSSALTNGDLGIDSSEEDLREFYATLALSLVTDAPAAVLTVCDPTLAASGQPAGTIVGDARDVPETEQIGAGLRSRAGNFGRASSAAAIGDRFVLPALSASSLIDLTADTVGGASSVRLGPFGASPVAVRVAGQLEAPQAVVEYADGTSSSHAVAPRAGVATTVRATTKRNRLTLTVRTAPGAFVTANAEATRESSDAMDNLFSFGPLAAASASGTASVTLDDLSRRTRKVDASIVDPERRTVDAWTCALRWRGAVIRSVRCSGGPGTPARRTGRVGAVRDQLAQRTQASPAAGNVAPPRANAAAAARPVAVAATTMLRARGENGLDLLLELEDANPQLFADVTGDGRPEAVVGYDLYDEQQLLVSTPNGAWKPVPLRLTLSSSDLTSGGDLNGDGVEELWATDFADKARAIAGSPTWSSTPPAKLDLRVDSVGPRDLVTGEQLEDHELPLPVADATGDGRPELAVPVVPSLRHTGFATYASEQLPLGRPMRLPETLVTEPGSIWDYVAQAQEEAAGLGGTDGGPSLRHAGGILSTLTTLDKPGGRAVTTIAQLSPDGQRLTALPALASGGHPTLLGIDPPTGELLARVAGSCGRRGCVSRLLRLAPDGRTLASLSVRSSEPITARFLDDGPDADARAEVVFRDPGGDFARKKGPGTDGSIGLWASASGSPAWKTLPVLAISGAPIDARGPLLGWTSPTGRHHVGTYTLRGKGERRLVTLVDVTAPK